MNIGKSRMIESIKEFVSITTIFLIGYGLWVIL